MAACEIGMMHCLLNDPTVKAELLSFGAIMLLPLAITIRLMINEIIFQKKFAQHKEALDRINARLKTIEMWADSWYK